MATFVLTLLALALLVTGIVLVVRGRSSGRSFPSCGNCGYDVSGSIGSVARCPECGVPFAEGGIVPPRSRRSRLVFATGVVLILVTVGAGIPAVFVTSVVAVNAQAVRAARAQAIQAQMAQQLAKTQAEASAALRDEAEVEEAQDAVEALEPDGPDS